MNVLFWDLKTYEPTGNSETFSVSTWPSGTPTLPGCHLGSSAPSPARAPASARASAVLTGQSFRTRAHPLSEERACALRSPEICPSAVLPTAITKNSSPGSPAFVSAREPGWGARPEFYGYILRETPQTSANARSWKCLSRPRLELGFFFFSP